MREGWSTYRLGEVSDFEGGSQPPKSTFIDKPRDGYIRLLQIRDFKSEKYAVYIPEAKKNRTCKAEDIMIGRYGASVGQIHRGKAGAYNVALIKTTPDEKIIDKNFFYYYLTSDLFQKPLMSVADRSAQAGFSKADIEPFKIFCPPLPEQKRIVAILDEAFAGIDQAIANTEKNLASARELFESYLNTIFTQKGEGWEEKTLSKLIDVTHGYAFKGPDFAISNDENKPIVLTPGNYAEDANLYFTIKNTKRFTGDIPQDYLFEVGDLTVVMTDLSSKMKILGKPAFIDRSNILHNQRIGRVIFKTKEAVPRFVYYFLRTRAVSEKIKETSTGTMVRHTAPKRILSINIPIPPSGAEQENIIATLDKISGETQNLESVFLQKIQVLNELKQSLLQKAFSGELTADMAYEEQAEAVA